MKRGKTASYLNVIRNIRNWPLFFAKKWSEGHQVLSFLTRGNPMRVEVPDHELFQVFKEIFASDFYGIDALLRKLPRNPIILDIGANVGYFELLLFSRLAAVTVYAYEPVPSNCALFERHMALNPSLSDRIHLVKKAVTGTPRETLELFLETDAANSVIASVYDDFDRQNRFRLKVPAISLQQILQEPQFERVDLLKLDCEGSEYPVIYETPSDCWRKINLLTMEVHDLDREHRNVGYLSGFLEGLGYHVTSEPVQANCHTLEAARKNP